MPDSPPGYDELANGMAVGDARRDVVSVSGPESASFLQGQLSQDVAALATGGSGWSWLLAPTGKVDALVRVTRLDAERWLVDTDAGYGAAAVARLARFKLRTKAGIEVLADWRVVGVRGASAGRFGEAPAGGIRVDASWPGAPGVDLMGPDLQAPGDLVGLDPAGWEVARIEAGVPLMGAELTERTIPAETGLIERTVSFTKGCYTGQELVARIDSRGANVPRHLRGVRLAGPAAAGDSVVRADGSDAGILTSVADSPVLGWVAIAYLRRGVAEGDTLRVGDHAATACRLPMISRHQ